MTVQDAAVDAVYALPQHLQCHLWLAMLEDPALLASKPPPPGTPQTLHSSPSVHSCPGPPQQSSLSLGSCQSAPQPRLLIRIDSAGPGQAGLPDWKSTSSIWPMASLRLEDTAALGRGRGSGAGKQELPQGVSLSNAAPQPVQQLLSECGLCRSSFMAQVQLEVLERLAAAVAGSPCPGPCTPSSDGEGEAEAGRGASYRLALKQHRDCSQSSRFAILNEITAGQEEVDDSIVRDVHRTFPEHPMFRSLGPGLRSGGQEALFRLLKAFSLHDLEVSYCQGMAFAAGVLLTCLPEEPAFRLFCKLMDAEGANLRRMYLPGLDALKEKLVSFDALLELQLPRLHMHLRQLGITAVLYVTQWLMTLWATPFGTHFSACVIDMMLLDGQDSMLLHIALGVMELLEAHLLCAPSFEQAFTALKVCPAEWGDEERKLVMQRALHYSCITAPNASCSTPSDAAAAAPPTPRVSVGAVQKLSKAQSQRYQGDSPMACLSPSGPDPEGSCEAVHKLEVLIIDLGGRASLELELDSEAIKSFVLWRSH